MLSVNTAASPAAVIHELQRMRSLGYFVVDEAFEAVRDFESSDFAGLSVSSLAFMACERGHAEYKSRLRATGAIDFSGK
jgi:DNA-binding IclR family transcriptional regulator